LVEIGEEQGIEAILEGSDEGDGYEEMLKRVSTLVGLVTCRLITLSI
jgi:hypothetical protein